VGVRRDRRGAHAGERLFGPYDWDRFDMLVMPPSFPYGGMENPRLTFLTPTLLAGDRSQVRVVAHELAHSWTGNLVTNADAEHFWLNEGWTATPSCASSRPRWRARTWPRSTPPSAAAASTRRRALQRRAAPSSRASARTSTGVDPDDAFSEVPYDKGCLFLGPSRSTWGARASRRFAKRYIDDLPLRVDHHRGLPRLHRAELPGVLEAVDAPAWIDGEGVPDNAPATRSEARWRPSRRWATAARRRGGARWSTDGVAALPRRASPARRRRGLRRASTRASPSRRRGNMEVKVAWLDGGLAAGYDPALPRCRGVLTSVGRMKYLKPLYDGLLPGRGARRQRPR
jgi:leukotriene-A4 hydrolase